MLRQLWAVDFDRSEPDGRCGRLGEPPLPNSYLELRG